MYEIERLREELARGTGGDVKLGTKEIGDDHPCYVIAEIGINHNGSLSLAKQLIDAAADAGADAVKFQKRTVDVVYTRAPFAEDYLDQPRTHPLRYLGALAEQTQGGQKQALEFDRPEWERLAMYARERGLDITASCWDERALADVLSWLGLTWLKVASPCLTDGPLMRAHGAAGLPLVVSTGMATQAEVDHALADLCDGDEDGVALLHCCSTYPADDSDLNLLAIPAMREYYGVPVGYSGHERGIATTVAAVALGACIVERHLTLDRAMYGSDQAASLEPHGFARMVRDIRSVEAAMGSGVKLPMESEMEAARKLRRVVD